MLGVSIFGAGIDLSVLLAIVILTPAFLIALGLAWFFSALGVFVRDISQIGSFLGLALLYSSGVFYSAAKAKATAPVIWTFLQWNPLLQIIDSLRKVVLWGGVPNWTSIAYCWIIGFVCLFVDPGFLTASCIRRCTLSFWVNFFGDFCQSMLSTPFLSLCPHLFSKVFISISLKRFCFNSSNFSGLESSPVSPSRTASSTPPTRVAMIGKP